MKNKTLKPKMSIKTNFGRINKVFIFPRLQYTADTKKAKKGEKV